MLIFSQFSLALVLQNVRLIGETQRRLSFSFDGLFSICLCVFYFLFSLFFLIYILFSGCTILMHSLQSGACTSA